MMLSGNKDIESAEETGEVQSSTINNFFKKWQPNKKFTKLFPKFLSARSAALESFNPKMFGTNNYQLIGDFYQKAFWLKLPNDFIEKLLLNRSQILSTLSLKQGKRHTKLEIVRKLFITFIIEVHHWNLYFDYMRSYGFSKAHRPKGHFYPTITNEFRLAINIVLRNLQFIRNDRVYNENKPYLAILLQNAVKARGLEFRETKSSREFDGVRNLAKLTEYIRNAFDRNVRGRDKFDKFVFETKLYEYFVKKNP